jgi:hypothetical protein
LERADFIGVQKPMQRHTRLAVSYRASLSMVVELTSITEHSNLRGVTKSPLY